MTGRQQQPRTGLEEVQVAAVGGPRTLSGLQERLDRGVSEWCVMRRDFVCNGERRYANG
jgi:hypothetical protein